MKKMKLWIKILLGIILVVAVAMAIILLVVVPNSENQTLETYALQFETLEEGTITSLIGATGKVESVQSTELFWGTNGIVEEIAVELGDQVADGQILASLEKGSMPESVIMAVEDYYNAKQDLEELKKSYSMMSIAEVEKAVAEAEEDVRDADWNYAYLSTPAAQTYIDQAYANMIIAKNSLNKAEEKWEEWENKSEDDVNRAYVQQELVSAQQIYHTRVSEYNYVSTPATEIELAIAKAEWNLAIEILSEAQQDLADLLAGAVPEEIAAAEAKVIVAKQNMEKQFIEAPFDGVITQTNSLINDSVTMNTPAFRLDDISTLQIDLEISELDINDIQIGQKAIIMLDSIVGVEYEGEVISKGLIGTSTSGIVYYPVIVQIENSNAEIQIGMTATVDIYVEQEVASVLVPNSAITVVDGQQVVYVSTESMGGFGGNQTETTPEEAQDETTDEQLNSEEVQAAIATKQAEMPEVIAIPISVGLSSDTFSTLVTGKLRAGMSVVTNPNVLIQAKADLESESTGIFSIFFTGGGANRDMPTGELPADRPEGFVPGTGAGGGGGDGTGSGGGK